MAQKNPPALSPADDSLRDWFAGQALAGWMASFPPGGEGVAPEACARLAYDLADAMLDARAKGGDT